MFRKRIVGQEGPKQALINIVERHQAGMGDPDLPAGNALFLGPTGTGKTHLVEVLCEALFGNPHACLKVDCAEYQHGHEISKLTGSPPGYLGHRETDPMLCQKTLDQYHTDKVKLSIILFDEVEKSSDTLWNLLLGILDKAKSTTGDNQIVSYNNTVVVMTSNIGSKGMSDLTSGGMGFSSQSITDAILDSKVDDAAKQAAKVKFSPEFFNRLEYIEVFHNLTEKQIEEILSIELGLLQSKFMRSTTPFFIHVQNSARALLLKEGYDKKYGARFLKRAISRRIVNPLAGMMASKQINAKDVVVIKALDEGGLQYSVSEREL